MSISFAAPPIPGAGHGEGHEALTWLLVGLVLIIGGVTIALFALIRRGRIDPRARTPLGRVLSVTAAVLSAEAAIIHFAVIGGHFRDWWVAGVGFAGIAWFQAIWAAMYLVRPSRSLRLVAISVNVGIVGLWLVTRFVGLPIGPDAWQAEPVGGVDLIASALEIGLVGVLLVSMPSRRTARRGVTSVSALQYGVTALSISVLVVTFALAGAFGDAHLAGRHPDEAPAEAQGD